MKKVLTNVFGWGCFFVELIVRLIIAFVFLPIAMLAFFIIATILGILEE